MTTGGSRASISSRGGSPTEDLPMSASAPPSGSRPVPVGGPPPIPERITPARHGSVSSITSEAPIDQPLEKAPSLSNVGRRDSQSIYIDLINKY